MPIAEAGAAVCKSAAKRPWTVRRAWLRALPFILLTPLGLLLGRLSTLDAAATERLWSTSVYPVLAQCVSAVTGLFPFSLAEMIIALSIPALTASVIVFVVRLVRGRGRRGVIVSRFVSTLLAIVSTGYFCFVLTGGINYNRLTFSDYSGLEIRESSVEELTALCRSLAADANELRAQTTVDENGVFALSQSVRETAVLARDSFSALHERYPVLAGRYSKPKPVVFSRVMSWLDIAGIFIPMTFESNVNVDMPDHSIPVTMCHEQTHLRGFMREDEANFIAYLACRDSDSIDFRYSGVMLALTNSMNALYRADYDAFCEIYYTYCDGILADYAFSREYWKQFEGPVAETSSKINDGYLKANNQTDGVQSYGRVVDLLLAEYRANSR